MPPFNPKKKLSRPASEMDSPSTENRGNYKAPVIQHTGSNNTQKQTSENKPPVGSNRPSPAPASAAPSMVVKPTASRSMASKHQSAYDKLVDRAVTRRGYY